MNHRSMPALMLVLCLLLSLTPAMAEEAPVVSVMFPSANIPADDGCVVEAIRQGSGVNIQLNVLSYDDYANKVATMLASKSLPDLFLSTGPTMTQELAQNGVILPLDDLLQEYGANILACKQEQLQGAGTVDGQIYAICTLGTENSSTLTLRKDWLDNLGLEIPTTLDDYFEVLRAFTYDDPNQNGVDDTIGLGAGGGTSHIFGAYGVNISYPNYENGQVVPALLCENYLPAVRYLNKLYNEGLYDREFLTLDTMTAFGKLWNGFVGAFEFNPNGTTQNWLWRYTEEVKPVFCFTVIRGEDGQGGTPRTIMDSSYAVAINAQCAQPEAAMKFIDFLCSDEGDVLNILGIEGTHFQ